MVRADLVLAGIALTFCACSSDNERDTGINPDLDAASGVDADEGDALPPKDGSVFVVHDAGGPISCTVTCDCPQGLACIDSACTSLGTPVWCCDKRGCPRGQQCLDQSDRPDVCEGDPDPADGGVRPDAGPGQIGDHCEMDSDCDPSMGFACWERFEPPGVWGYCTLIDCLPTCPESSSCITWQDEFGNPVATGCMEGCNVEGDCSSYSFCVPLANLPTVGICVPKCQDDFFDCSPRDGTVYCDPATGIWFPCANTPSHDNTALIGDPCLNSTQCATGDICLGQFGWRFDDGMCSHVCDGLPEASPCPIGSSCQYLPPPNDALGLCFRDCVGATCPDRPGATCDVYDPSWLDPSCIPPILP